MADHKFRLKELSYLHYSREYNNEDYKVYAMINPIDNSMFYIGCTKQPMYVRINQHYTEVGYGDKDRMIEKLALNGMVPIIDVLYTFKDKHNARLVEVHLINFVLKNKRELRLTNSVHRFNISINETEF
jgi:hypothetical protein